MSRNLFGEGNGSVFLAQAMAALEPGDIDRAHELEPLYRALKHAQESTEAYPIMEALENRAKAFEAAVEAQDWEQANRHSKAHLDLVFRYAAAQRTEQARDWAMQALADRLELVEQLEPCIPGLREQEWGLSMRAKHFFWLFQ